MSVLQYRSTRSSHRLGSFQDILLEGLAPDGGLAMPESIPRVDAAELAALAQLPYPALAAAIMGRFADDIPTPTLAAMTAEAYTAERFGSPAITPVSSLGMEDGSPLDLLELSNGPTLAFKDMAMQMLGPLFSHVLAERGQTLNILGATSGDTGSAAEYAMRGRERIRVFMLSPEGRMSAFQKAQMYSLQDPNIINITVPGSFDVAQDLVKGVSADAEFKARQQIGTVNSINWARITAQTVYYFAGYFQAIRAHGLSLGDPIDVAVPSGNFGNVLSGYIAKQMGLPLGRLVVATNENDVLDEFFRTLVYRPRATEQTFVTSSPSMDISKASNFERYVFEMVGRDADRLAALWRQLASEGSFSLAGTPAAEAVRASGLVSGRSHHAARIETIRRTHHRTGRIIDPHTADGVFVARSHLRRGIPMLVLETALPAKFNETIVEALGISAPRPAGLESIESLPQKTVALPADLQSLKALLAERIGAAAA